MAEKENTSLGDRLWAGFKSALLWGAAFVAADLIFGKIFKMKVTNWDWKMNVTLAAGFGIWDAATLKPKDKPEPVVEPKKENSTKFRDKVTSEPTEQKALTR